MSHAKCTRAGLAAIALLLGPPGAARAGMPAGSPVREVIVVYKTHFDIGYTDTAANVVQKYRTTMMDQALAVVERNRDLPPERQFVWTVAAWPMTKILEDWPGQTPARRSAVLSAFREGRFAAQAMPFTVQTELEDPETLVRGLGFASRLTQEAGLPLPRGAKMTDVPGHSWLLPTLLTHAGVSFLHLGCNAASASPRVPKLFWWEGPDGSRLLTFYSAAGYGTGLEPPPGWPHRTWLAMVMSGDNAGPPTPESVKQLLDQAAKTLPGVTVRIGQLSDFADRIRDEKPELPVVRGDMPDTWIHGPQCDPPGVSLARNAAPAAAAAEGLATELHAWGIPAADPAPALARSHEQALLYFEHTWGGSLSWVTNYGTARGTGTADHWVYGDPWTAEHRSGRFARLEASWEEHSDHAREASAAARSALDTGLSALAHATGVNGRRVVVYNPLPWARDGLVSTALPGPSFKALQPAGGGSPVKVEPVGSSVRFFARDVPPLGYRVYTPVEGEPGRGQRVEAKVAGISNARLHVELDAKAGAIRSIVDRRTGRELVDLGAPYRFGQYVYERFDADQVASYIKAYVKTQDSWGYAELGKPNMPPASEVPRQTVTPTNGRLWYENGADSVTAVLDSSVGGTTGSVHDVRTRVTLLRDQPYLDIEVTVTKPPDPWPEACWLAFPFRADSPRFRVSRGASVIDPARDIVPGANRHMMATDAGVAVLDPGGRGGALCSPDAPLVSLGEPGCWKFSWEDAPRKGTVFVNLFNNQWTTNYRLWNGGRWTYRVRVWPVGEADRGDGPALVTPGLEVRHPLLAAAADGPAGSLPVRQDGLAVSRAGVLVTAFGREPQGRSGTLLRVWERAGEAGRLTVRLPAGLKATRARPVNLRGEPAGEPIAVQAGAFAFGLGRHAPASFVLD